MSASLPYYCHCYYFSHSKKTAILAEIFLNHSQLCYKMVLKKQLRVSWKTLKTTFCRRLYVCNSGYGIWQVFSYKNNICNALTKSIEKNMGWQQLYKPRTTVPQWSLVLSKPQTFKLGQRIWEDKFWGIWGIFGRFISIQFFTVSSLSMVFLNQVLFLQKN